MAASAQIGGLGRLAAISCLLAVLLFGLAGQAGAASPQKSPSVQKVSLLYVVSAKQVRLIPIKGSGQHFRLVLRGLERSAVWFSDRPARRSGSFPSRGLASSWAGFGFAANPPNAALAYVDRRGSERTAILELRRPRIGKPGLVFNARLLGPGAAKRGNLAGHAAAADGRPSRQARDGALFIDDTSAPVIDGCVLQPYTQCPGGYSFQSATLSGLDLTGANFSGPFLGAGQTSGASFFGATLRNVNLSGADLEYSEMQGVTIENSNFSGANLYGVYLDVSTVIGSDFSNANLSGGRLNNLEFRNSSLKGAKVETYGLLETSLCNTTLPNGTLSNENCGRY